MANIHTARYDNCCLVVGMTLCYVIVQTFRKAKHPMLIVGSELLQRQDGNALLSAAMTIADSAENDPEWKVLNILQKVRMNNYSE